MNVGMIFGFAVMVIFLGAIFVGLIYYSLKVREHSEPDYQTPLVSRQPAGDERRRHPRTDVNWPVSMETPAGTVSAEVKNISLGGAFISCKKSLPVGEVFRLTMMVPDSEPVMASAKVVWTNANVPDEKVVNRGMGVQFLKMSDRHIQIVRQLFPEGA